MSVLRRGKVKYPSTLIVVTEYPKPKDMQSQQKIIHNGYEAILENGKQSYTIWDRMKKIGFTNTNRIVFYTNSDYCIGLPELGEILELAKMCTISLYGTTKP